jgi:hypothetical protein
MTDSYLPIHAVGNMDVILFGQIPRNDGDFVEAEAPGVISLMALPGGQNRRPGIYFYTTASLNPVIYPVVGRMPFDEFFPLFIDALNATWHHRPSYYLLEDLVKMSIATATRFVIKKEKENEKEFKNSNIIGDLVIDKLLDTKSFFILSGLESVGELVDEYSQRESHRRYLNRMARIIQRKFRAAVSDPYHPICQRRLMREFNELTN